MADTAIAITAGTGTNVDTRTEATNGNHRQVIVVGDPSTNAGVAPVDATKGLAVDLTASGANTNALLMTMATLPVVASGNFGVIGGSLSAFQGGNWLVSVATLPVIANINNTSIPVTQSGTWDEIGINDSGNSITIDGNVGVAGGSLTAFQGGAAWKMTLATLPVMAEVVNTVPVTGTFFQATQPISGTVQPGNTPNTTAWLVTMATLPVVGEFSVAGQATVTALQGNSGTQAWLVTMATLPVVANINNTSIPVTQSGTWDEVGINDSGNSITVDGNVGVIGGSLSSYVHGGSISAFQGGTWNVGLSAGTNNIGDVDIATIAAGDNNIGNVDAIQSGAWTVQPGNTPNTTAWLVTMATLPVVGEFSVAGQATVTAIQGDAGSSAWLMTMATLPVMANIVNTSIPVTQSGTWDEVGINDSGNSITIDGNVGVIGGSLSVWNAGGSLSVFQGTPFWQVTMATMPVVGDFSLSGEVGVAGGSISSFNAGGSLSAFQGGSWLVSVATLPVVATILNSTLAVTQSGTWDEIGINDSGNSITVDQPTGSNLHVVLDAGTAAFGKLAANSGVDIGDVDITSIAAGDNNIGNVDVVTMPTTNVAQSGVWNVFSSMASGTNFIAGGQYLPTMASMSALEQRRVKQDLFGNLMVNTNVPLPNSTRFNRFLTVASMASLMAAPGAGRRLVIKEMDFSVTATVSLELYEDHAGTPARVWGPHYFLPYTGFVKPDCYIPATANKSLGVNISGGTFNSTLDVRIETENV